MDGQTHPSRSNKSWRLSSWDISSEAFLLFRAISQSRIRSLEPCSAEDRETRCRAWIKSESCGWSWSTAKRFSLRESMRVIKTWTVSATCLALLVFDDPPVLLAPCSTVAGTPISRSRFSAATHEIFHCQTVSATPSKQSQKPTLYSAMKLLTSVPWSKLTIVLNWAIRRRHAGVYL